MPTPYPWNRERTWRRTVKMHRVLRNVLLGLGTVLGLANPVGYIAYFIMLNWFRQMNDSPSRLPKIVGGLSLIAGIIVYGFAGVLPWVALQMIGTPGFSAISFILAWTLGLAPLSLFIMSLAVWSENKRFDLEANHFLTSNSHKRDFWKYNSTQRHRIKKAKTRFQEGTLDAGVMEVGVVVDDIIPWRRNKIGQIVATPINNMRHMGVFGGTGTGKTILAMNCVAEVVEAGWSVFFPDFKGSRRTEAMLAAIARTNKVPFYSFWVNERETGFHYDPLKGPKGLPPVDVFLTALGFSTEGDSEHYTSIVNTYLNNQFRALEEGLLEVGEDQSTFDWLWSTSDPDKFHDMLNSAAGNRDKSKAEVAKIIAGKVSTIKMSDLSGYRSKLNNIIDTVGEKLRPSPNSIDLRDVAANEGIVYFGLPSSGDKMVMRAIGALVIRDTIAMMNEREQAMSDPSFDPTPVLLMPDECSQLGDSADLLLEVFQMGRSARIVCAPIFQTAGSVTEKFVREMLGNDPSLFVLRVSDAQTAELLKDHFGEMPVRSERRNTQASHDGFSAEYQQATGSGGMGEIQSDARIAVNDIANLEPLRFFAYFPGSSEQATLKAVRSRRVRGDMVKKDIPTTLSVSRTYILESENDFEGVEDALQFTLDLNRDNQLDEGPEHQVQEQMENVRVNEEPVFDPGPPPVEEEVFATPVEEQITAVPDADDFIEDEPVNLGQYGEQKNTAPAPSETKEEDDGLW